MYTQFSNSLTNAGDGIKLTPKQLIRKHIFDPNHIVTDEELSQLEVGIKPFPQEINEEERNKSYSTHKD